MAIERIYIHRSAQDLEIEPVEDFVSFIEELTAKERAYSIRQKTTGEAIDEEAILQEYIADKPIIGYGGPDTFPFISDPDQEVRGVFAVIDRSLIYSRGGAPLHEMRDGYTWAFTTPEYYLQGKFIDVVHAFIDKGYPLLKSGDLKDYMWKYKFNIEGKTTIEEILKANK